MQKLITTMFLMIISVLTIISFTTSAIATTHTRVSFSPCGLERACDEEKIPTYFIYNGNKLPNFTKTNVEVLYVNVEDDVKLESYHAIANKNSHLHFSSNFDSLVTSFNLKNNSRIAITFSYKDHYNTRLFPTLHHFKRSSRAKVFCYHYEDFWSLESLVQHGMLKTCSVIERLRNEDQPTSLSCIENNHLIEQQCSSIESYVLCNEFLESDFMGVVTHHHFDLFFPKYSLCKWNHVDNKCVIR